MNKTEYHQRYREKQIEKHGSIEAYNQYLANRKREQRRKKKLEKEKSAPPVIQNIDSTNIMELANQLKSLADRLLAQDTSNHEIQTIIQYVREQKPIIEKIESNEVKDISEAIFVAKSKSLKSYKATTHRNIMNKLKFLSNKIAGKWDLNLFHDTDRVLDFINTYWSNPNTRQAYLQAISGLLRYVKGFEKVYSIYSNKSVDHRKKLTYEDNKLLKSKKESKAWLDWDEIVESVDVSTLTSKERAIVGLYVLIPPRRIAMIKHLKLGDGNDTNYNYLTNDTIIMNNYKTSHLYGQYVINLPDKLKQILRDYIIQYRINPNEHVFQTATGKPYSNYISTIFRNSFKKATGKPITQQILRHIYVSHRMKEDLDLNDKIEIAKSLGHSVSMFAKYNRR